MLFLVLDDNNLVLETHIIIDYNTWKRRMNEQVNVMGLISIGEKPSRKNEFGFFNPVKILA